MRDFLNPAPPRAPNNRYWEKFTLTPRRLASQVGKATGNKFTAADINELAARLRWTRPAPTFTPGDRRLRYTAKAKEILLGLERLSPGILRKLLDDGGHEWEHYSKENGKENGKEEDER